jgi:hypothetical protein
VGALVEVAPLVDARGTTYVIGTRGEVVAVAPDGTERWRASTGAMQPGPGALLSDDTVVFVDAAGEAVAVREGSLRWRVRFGRGDAAHPAPLTLDDGGVVVATTRDLAVLDADGRERARTTLAEPTTVPLLAALGKVVAVTASGAVWTWSPGAEPTRVASFGAGIDDGAVLTDDHTLIAVTAARGHVAAVDLVRGTTTTRAVAPAGLWLGPPAVRAGVAYLVLLAPTSELAVGIDASGAERIRAPLGTRLPAVTTDGGVAPLVAGPHTPALIDDAGTLAFATTDGAIGVIDTAAGATVELLADACPPFATRAVGGGGVAAPTVALAPLEPGVFVAACRSGTLLAVHGAGPAAAASGERQPPHL